jgi:gluconolactonase
MYEEDKNELTMLESTLEYPNGLALSPDETILYIADTKTLTLHKMDLETGKLELFVQFEESYGEGKPDGFRLDEKGSLYVTGPGGIWLIASSGKKLGLIKMPEIAANLCFDDKGIFITASTGIYRVDTKIRSAV